MRGSPFGSSVGSAVGGIIPAHAGLTSSSFKNPQAKRDHPRACGAHSHQICRSLSAPGSSPRMRGSHGLEWHRAGGAGIIPAHAGLTLSGRPYRGTGEGSSPRMRGSQVAAGHLGVLLGIIPAHAGLTDVTYVFWGRNGDHPRACGAHVNGVNEPGLYSGSSPRMRGSLGRLKGHTAVVGIIPAHAGLTGHCGRSVDACGDHPRACGAHILSCLLASLDRGSSPRMRGSPQLLALRAVCRGIIPAHAGLTLKNPNIDAILSGPHPVFYSVLRVIR